MGKGMVQIKSDLIQEDMAKWGYNFQRLATVLQCSGQGLSTMLQRGAMDSAKLDIIEILFEREAGYYNADVSEKPITQSATSPEMYALVAKLSTDISGYMQKQNAELFVINSSIQLLLASLNSISRSIKALEGTSKNNSANVVTAVSKMRTDTEEIKSVVKSIERGLK